jgi:hypothetical protein
MWWQLVDVLAEVGSFFVWLLLRLFGVVHVTGNGVSDG